jgi:hypothetical protein
MKASAPCRIAVMAAVLITSQSAYSQQAGFSDDDDTMYISGSTVLRNPYRSILNNDDSGNNTFPSQMAAESRKPCKSIGRNYFYNGLCKPIDIINFNSGLAFYDNDNIDSIKNTNLTKNKLKYHPKKPGIAFALAFFPGFFVHGLGHYYIGDKGAGITLTFVELLSFLILPGQLWPSEDDAGKKYSKLIGPGTILFFGSWGYDFIASPIKAEKINDNRMLSLMVLPSIKHNTPSIRLYISYGSS